MRRLASLAVLLAVTAIAGTAHADTFAVVPTAPLALPGLSPNPSLVVPSVLSAPPAAPVQLSYPQLLGLWQRAGAAYGIPWQVLAAINKVESNWGRNMGPSSAGAIGWMQFMPSTWLRWGVDANGDGVADPWDPTDAVFSAARYLAAAGGSTDLYRAVYAYNHADWYVNEVLSLANLYGGDSTLAFSLDGMQQNLDAARQAAAHEGELVIAAEKVVERESRVVAHWQARAAKVALLSDQLALEQRAGHAAERRDAANARVVELKNTLATLQQRVARAQEAAASSSFDPATSQLLAAPSYAGGYVFPVGGGPGVVFASHTHHDYPAVDIAAPMGSPLYALANSVVLRSWTMPDPRCGIGFTVQAFDGQVWTYCHLSVLDPTVVAGATLTAGEGVGLVGATGDATGPHLHLQLQPATAWPQQEAWFQSFAGKAFTWSDSGPAAPGRALAFVAADTALAAAPTGGPVFQVISPQTASPAVVYFSRAGA
jgi:murein DD-endopeptidase MepM/ murein hydrolase activator NlpD